MRPADGLAKQGTVQANVQTLESLLLKAAVNERFLVIAQTWMHGVVGGQGMYRMIKVARIVPNE
jgi:hypothetical protein